MSAESAYTAAELARYECEIRGNDPGLSDDEVAEAMACFAEETPDERSFFRGVRRVAGEQGHAVTYAWIDRQLCLRGIRLRDDV